jgi:transglutaminase-like putative cysteine protease
LAAAARACGIPSAIGLSDVINHFTSPKLKKAMGGREIFLHHGYATLYLGGNWVKAAPAFNIDLCTRFGVPPTEFDGINDAILQKYDAQNNVRMEYLRETVTGPTCRSTGSRTTWTATIRPDSITAAAPAAATTGLTGSTLSGCPKHNH